jgi:abortive infection bacteriophage resistance protein
MTTPYPKQWLSIPDQLLKLKSYGLSCRDDSAACDFLEHINYYRFSGYGLTPEEIAIVEGREAGTKKAEGSVKPVKAAAGAKKTRKSVLTEDPDLG